MGRRRVSPLRTTGAIIGATAMAFVGSPAIADTSPQLRLVPDLLTAKKPLESTSPVTSLAGAPAGIAGFNQLPTAKTEQRYTVKSGDTVWALAQKFQTTVAKIIDANGLGSNALIRVGQTLTIPGTGANTSSTPSSKPAAPQSQATHTVRSGETLSGIAAKYKTTTAKLVSWNSISNPNLIRPGQVLRVSATSSSAPSKPSTPNTSTPTAPNTSAPTASTYKVKAGDTVWAISVAHKVSVSAIVAANGLGENALIRVGQVLQIPNGSTGSTSTPTPKPTPNACQNVIPNTFLHYTYPDDVVKAANENKCTLDAMSVPSRDAMQQMVRDTAANLGVDPALALAVAFQESGFNQRAVSPANAIGTMQVIPSSGDWAGQLLGRKINLLDPQDNVSAGVAILRSLQRTFPDDLDKAIGAYYQGAGSVSRYGLASDTRMYVSAVKAHMSRFQ